MPFAKINEKSIFYTDDSEKVGSPLTTVFIHGLGSSSCFYKTITPHLQSVTRCIALDTPGSGLSELGNSEQSIKSISSDVIGLLDHLDVNGEFVVVGHSMGGIVASEIAAAHPKRVKAVIGIGPVDPQPKLATVFKQRIEAVKKGKCHHAVPFSLAARLLSVNAKSMTRWIGRTCWYHPNSSNGKIVDISSSRFRSKPDPRHFT